jgi:hypothetical protein
VTITTDALRQRLAALPGTFSITGEELGVTAAENLFTTCLPDGTLELAFATARPDALSVAGQITLPGVGSGGPLSAMATFTSDSANISGVEFTVTLDTWQLATTYLTLDLTALRTLHCSAARLILSADPDGSGGIGVEVDLPVPASGGSRTLTLRGFEPPPGPAGPASAANWELDAAFDGVTLADLADLAKLAPGLQASDFDLSALGVLDDLALNVLRVVYDPWTRTVMGLDINVTVKRDWPLVAGKCELTDIRVGFSIGLPLIAPTVDVWLSGTVLIGGVPVAASISYPELAISAELQEPVPATAIFGQYLPAAAVDMDVEQASLWVDAGTRGWEVSFGVDSGSTGGWRLTDGVTLTDVSVTVSGTGTATPSATCGARFDAGGAPVLLGGSYSGGAWSLTGNTVDPGGLDAGRFIGQLGAGLGVHVPAPIAEMTLTEVDLAIATGPSFAFTCIGDFPLAGTPAGFVVHIDVGGTPFSAAATGELTLTVQVGGVAQPMRFGITFEQDTTKSTFTASWTDSPGVPLAALLDLLGVNVSELPGGLLPTLTEMTFGYDTNGPSLVLGVGTQDTVSVWGVTGASPWRLYAGALQVGTEFRLSELPLIGHELGPSEDLGLDGVSLRFASAAVPPATAAALNLLIPAQPPPGVTALPSFPMGGIVEGLALELVYDVGGTPQPPLTLSLGQAPAPQIAAAAGGEAAPAGSEAAAGPSASGPPTAWLALQRSFGPLALERAGVSYSGGTLWLLLDGAISAGGLALSLDGAGVGFDLDASGGFPGRFRIDGLGLTYDEPPIALAGALLFVPASGNIDFEVAGLATVETPPFSLSVAGAYARVAGQPSMFVFGAAGAEFGGPPCFFVTGLGGGFGFNSSLRIPGQDEVAQFPLVVGLADPQGFAKRPALSVLTDLTGGDQPWVSWEPGSLWLAAGLKFTSFELVTTTAVLIGELGQELVLALVGTSEATFPQLAGEGPTYARVILDLEAVYRPSQGEFIASAVLANGSYVLDPACALTGGFAFAIWFEPSPHAGDFVVTLGGYHPAFQPPAWYPSEPRLGFSWSLSDHLSISGGAYFALTPSAVMAGGALDVSFHSGDLRAWLTAYADMLIRWKPFQYQADIGVRVGASYELDLLFCTKTVSVELGADLSIWGPPTGGTARVHWWVISFTIDFGPGPPDDATPLNWSEFQTLLPAPEHALLATPVSGVVPASTATPSTTSGGVHATPREPEPQPWIVSAYGFTFRTSTVVPASSARGGATGTATPHVVTGGPLAILPMQTSQHTSTHTVTVTLGGGELDVSDWTFEPVRRGVPTALWGTGDPTRLAPADGQLIADQVTGFTVSVPAPAPTEPSPGPIADPADFESDPLPSGRLPITPRDEPTGPPADQDAGSIATIGAQIANHAGRDALYRQLLDLGVATAALRDDPMTGFAPLAGHTFEDPPLVLTDASKGLG